MAKAAELASEIIFRIFNMLDPNLFGHRHYLVFMTNTVSAQSREFHIAKALIPSIQLPDFQRSLVWIDNDKRNLLFSTILGFPIGAICIGEDLVDLVPVRYLLDGQQRLDCISDMLVPEIAASWVIIPPPYFPTDSLPSSDTEWKKYSETKFMEQIYAYLDLGFEESEDYISMEAEAAYCTLLVEKDTLKRAKPRPTSQINSKQKEIVYFKHKALEAYVDSSNDKAHGEHLPFFEDFKMISTMCLLIESKRKKEADLFLEQRNVQTPLTHVKRCKLLDKLENKMTATKEEFSLELLTGLGSPTELRPRGGKGKAALSADEKKVLRQETQRDFIVKRIVENIDDHYDEFIKFLQLRKTFTTQFGDHKVGWLEFKAYNREFTEYELSKVFKLINMEGVTLTLIELLAARSIWRKTVSDLEDETYNQYRDISVEMGLHGKYDIELVREKCNKWHLASGFIAILLAKHPDRTNWLMNFPTLPPQPPASDDDLEKKKAIQKERTKQIQSVSEASFKLLSLLRKNSVEKKVWKNLAKDLPEEDWRDLAAVATTLRAAGQALIADVFFKKLISFDTKGTLESIFQVDFACRFFVKTMLDEYLTLNSPSVGHADCKKFQYIMRRWFDHILYQAVTNYWPGGAEQKLTDGLDNPLDHTQLDAKVAEESWKDLIEEMCDSDKLLTRDYVRTQTKVKGLEVSMGDCKDKVKPILIYHQVLQGRGKNVVEIPENKDAKYEFHVDHIVSRKAWAKALKPHKNNPGDLFDHNHCHNIANLTLLGYDANMSKGAKPAELYFDGADGHKTGDYHDYIKEQLETFGDLPDDAAQVSVLTKVANFDQLKELRRDKMVEVFSYANRQTHLFDTGP